MKWSWKVARVADITIQIHWTFLILIAWVILAYLSAGENLLVALQGVVFICTVFVCVVLHELGHALTARGYGIKTRDITLLPIGGVARLEKMPDNPRHELIVAAAGPAVNVVIAALLFVLFIAMANLQALADVPAIGGGVQAFVAKLLFVNVALVLFNLLPAFPMDGGRMLRALLAQQMSYEKATRIAANTGQAMAVGFAILGLFLNFILLFIALFVYIGAQGEAEMVQMRSVFADNTVRDAMMTEFHAVREDQRLTDVVDTLLAGSQEDFPVVSRGHVAGMLFRKDLMQALARQGPDTEISQVMKRDCAAVDENEPLDKLYQRMRQDDCTAMPVMRDGEPVGLINLENVTEWAMVRSALNEYRTHDS